MTIDKAQGIGHCFTFPVDYDDAPQDRRWACDIATAKDADGVRRVYATDCRAAVQVTTDGFGIGSAWGGSGYVPDGFRLDQVRAFFEHWPTDQAQTLRRSISTTPILHLPCVPSGANG